MNPSSAELQRLLQLPLAERIQLAEALWDSVEAERESEAVPPDVLDELRERKARYDADPSSAVSWAEVQRQIRER